MKTHTPKERATLTKSLHTVTAVSRLARHLIVSGQARTNFGAVRLALYVLGQDPRWSSSDATFTACVNKLNADKHVDATYIVTCNGFGAGLEEISQ